MEKNEIIVYQSNTGDDIRLDVRVEDETVWLNRQQIAVLFGRDVKTIGKHINNVFSEGELIREVVVANIATTTQHGAIKGKTQKINVEYYNLDVIISVGYRVKSQQGTQFRIWATNVLREYLLKGYALNQRMNRVETRVDDLSKKMDIMSLHIQASQLPNQGIFFNGQVFDAYTFVADLIRSANKSLILIDNYIDDTFFTLLKKRKKGVNCVCYTQSITKNLSLDLEKHNQQYPAIDLKELKMVHDRFLIIDERELYHIGASLKDLGKKWFAFSKLNWDVGDVIRRIRVDNP